MDFGYETVAIIFSILALIISYYAYTISKRQLHQPTLEYLRRDYRSPEMVLALSILWSYKRKWKKQAVEEGKTLKDIVSVEYPSIANFEENNIDIEQDYDKKLNLINKSLSYQRRLVITFYYYLYEVFEYKILTPRMIFEYWDYDTLDIIEFLKLIEMEQAKIFAKRDDKKEGYIDATKELLKKLDRLRDASFEYSKKKKSFWGRLSAK